MEEERRRWFDGWTMGQVLVRPSQPESVLLQRSRGCHIIAVAVVHYMSLNCTAEDEVQLTQVYLEGSCRNGGGGVRWWYLRAGRHCSLQRNEGSSMH